MKTLEQVIEEAYDKGYSDAMMEERNIGSPDQTSEQYAKEKAQELPGPVSSPSDLIVEVDGEEKGPYAGTKYTPHDGGIWWIAYSLSGVPGESRNFFKLTDHHIRLLNPQGGVWMDNKLNHKSE